MENLTPVQQALVNLLWDYMKRDPEHRDRVQTAWGTKTKQGLVACIERIVVREELPAEEVAQ